MSQQPLLSVIVPVYGTEKYVGRCLDSILGQTYHNLEVIVVNDGTRDQAETVIKKYLFEDERIKYVRHSKNKGLFQARISGAEEANGKYLAFVDSDDYISCDYYRMLVKKAEETGADIVVGDTVFEDLDHTKTVRPLYQMCFEKDILEGTEIRDAFFAQQGYCFSWHTIWNKIYERELWNGCMDAYRTVKKHLIMTEDVAFSVPLLYRAKKLAKIDTVQYFYCASKEASTAWDNITFKKFAKRMEDLNTAFHFVEQFLESEQADEVYRRGFLAFKKKYARMYRSLQEERFEKNEEAEELVDAFLPGYKETQREDELCFDVITAHYNGGIENIKKGILSKKVKCVSFDIFDTLVARPLYEPTDLMDLMEPEFERLTDGSYNISFAKIRSLSEAHARKENRGFEDVTLSEIYGCMKERFSIGEDTIDRLYQTEKEYEVRFSKVRKTGKELYEFAHDAGKRIVLTSDMYLETDTVEKILEKNGYRNHEKLYLSSKERALKGTGLLFKRMLKGTGLTPESVLHIGDNWRCDMEAAKKLGIRTAFFPKAREVFENVIQGITTNNCGWMDKYMAGPFSDYKAARKSPAYRAVLAMTANRFFDNPYMGFQEKSDFNGNPYMLGYYAAGPHCLGIAGWLLKELKRAGKKNIYFLARDGYLPKQMFDIINDTDIQSYYLHASRKMTMPFMIQKKEDMYQLPVESSNHSPLSLCRMLAFCSRLEEEEMEDYLNQHMAADARFKNKEAEEQFIDFFIEGLFDEEKLKKAQENMKRYYSVIQEDSATFDMGYSGRIQSAISKAYGKPLDGYFVHSDNERIHMEQRKNGYKIQTMYDTVPTYSGIMREYLLSDPAPACIGLELQNEKITEIFEEDCTQYPEAFVMRMLHKGVLDFASEYARAFKGVSLPACYRELSYPFEYFLRFSKHEDRKLFQLCSFEDTFYGNIASVRADTLFTNQLCGIEEYKTAVDFTPLEPVKLDIKDVNEKEKEFPEVEEEKEPPYPKRKRKKSRGKVCMFRDVIEDASISDTEKMQKCAGNTSNLVHWNAIDAMLSPMIISNWYMEHEGGFEQNEFDVFLTTNLIFIQEGADLTYLRNVLKKIGDRVLLPLGIGLSAETEKKEFWMPEETVTVLREIAQRCDSVGVRGEYTAEILAGYGIKNSTIIGDPSLYTGIGEIKKAAEKPEFTDKSIVGSFKPFYGKLTQKEMQFLKYMKEYMFEFVETTSLEPDEQNIADRETLTELKSYLEKKKVYYDAEEWKRMFASRQFAMGMNFHNNVLAVQSGVPALFLNYETSGREMCRFFGLPHIEIAQFRMDEPVEVYYEMADYTEFEKGIKKKQAQFLDFLDKNGVAADNFEDRIIVK